MEESGMDWDWYYEKHNPEDDEESPQDVLERETEDFGIEEV